MGYNPNIPYLVVSNIFYVHPYLGEMIQFDYQLVPHLSVGEITDLLSFDPSTSVPEKIQATNLSSKQISVRSAPCSLNDKLPVFGWKAEWCWRSTRVVFSSSHGKGLKYEVGIYSEGGKSEEMVI